MKKMITMYLGLAFLAVLAGSPARAEDVKAGDLVISQAWSRATPNGDLIKRRAG